MIHRHKSFALFISIVLFITPQCVRVNAQSAVSVSEAEAVKWREDLRYLAEQMPKVHKNLFHSITREEFQGAVGILDEKIPKLARHQIIIEMMRIAAMIGEGDGHTSLNPYFNPKIGFRYYPIKLYLFSDGLFIQAADRKYTEAVGARVLKIGNFTADRAYNTVSEVVSRDNSMTLKHRVPNFLIIPEVLHGLGLIDNMEKAQLLVEKNGRQMIIELTPAGMLPQRSHGPVKEPDPTEDWLEMNDGSNYPVPLWLKAPDNNYWFEYLEDSKTVYIQYNKVGNKNGETIAEFAHRLFNYVRMQQVDRFVLDIRANEGGDSFYNMPILLGIIKSEKINRRGHLFTIIGRETFSAAQNLANELERYTNTIFVGEPTGAKANFYGDHELVILPNSGISVAVSTQWWQMNPRDNRRWIAPSVTAELSSEDFKTNNDPAMIAISNYQSILEVLESALSTGNIELVINKYRAFKSNPKTVSINTERDINTLGYKLLSLNKFSQAVEIFKLNVEAYPNSSNVYDSLGDGYAKIGNKDLAIKNYQRALDLNPESLHTRNKLEQLKHK